MPNARDAPGGMTAPRPSSVATSWLIDRAELARILGVRPSSFRQMDLPSAIRLTRRIVRWDRLDADVWAAIRRDAPVFTWARGAYLRQALPQTPAALAAARAALEPPPVADPPTTGKPTGRRRAPEPARVVVQPLITTAELVRRLDIAKSTLAGLGLPGRYRLSQKVIRWQWAEVEAWLRARKERSRRTRCARPRAVRGRRDDTARQPPTHTLAQDGSPFLRSHPFWKRTNSGAM